MSPRREIDPDFSSLPLRKLADVALQRARDFKAEHADFRAERLRTQRLVLNDAALVNAAETDEIGFAVRVIVDGAWGFAAGSLLTSDEVVRVTEQAVRMAMIVKPLAIERIELADEPVYDNQVWI